jgi:hypothetical protein
MIICKQLASLQKKHRELIGTHAKTKTTIRQLRNSQVVLEHACEKGKTDLAAAEGTAAKKVEQCRAVETKGAEVAGKLDRLTIETEVRYVHFFF